MNFYNYLCCPECQNDLDISVEKKSNDTIETGKLTCVGCGRVYPITGHIPRFVESDNYATSFGFQWERFNQIRYDSYTKSNIIRNTILRRSGWEKDHFNGKLLLECGCGAGHDTEALLNMGAKVLSFDFSSSVEQSWKQNSQYKNLLIVQADIANLPIKKEMFDIVFCHRVIQHTPEPKKSFYSIAARVKKDGNMFLHSYSTRLKSMLHYKYLLRPLTKRMRLETIYNLLERFGPRLYKLVGLAIKYRLKFLRKIIPFENMDSLIKKHNLTLSDEEKYQFSFMVTFDALTPKYDRPNSFRTIRNWFKDAGFDQIVVRRKKPVVVVGTRCT
jgi:ubiquinone/menaquinone biosynthesis C-methylase UbiE/uncharacterized protein YbaR (Trm112 family)